MSKNNNILTNFWRNRHAYDEDTIKSRFKAFTRMIPLVFRGDYPARKRNIIVGVAAAIYAISPLDFIPEIALGPFGLLDDFVILGIGLKMIDKEIDLFLKWEEEQKDLIVHR